MKLLLFLTLIPSLALAELPWYVAKVNGANQISAANLDAAFLRVQALYKKAPLGINLTLVAVDEYPAQGSYTNDLHSLSDLSSWNYWYTKLRNRVMVKRLLTVVHPPILDKGQKYFAGLSWRRGIGSVDRNFSMAWCGDKEWSCGLVMAHELGHTLGAGDQGGACSVMHGAAGHECVSGSELFFNNISTTGIRRRLKKVGLWEESRS